MSQSDSLASYTPSWISASKSGAERESTAARDPAPPDADDLRHIEWALTLFALILTILTVYQLMPISVQ